MRKESETSELLLDPSLHVRAEMNWYQRTFSKMNRDSLRGSIFIMLLTALGTGVFTLHHLFNKIGIVYAILLIIIIGGCFGLTSDMLTHALSRKPGCQSMGDLNTQVLGRAAFAVYNVLVFIYIMLCLIANMSSMSKIIYLNFETLIWQIIGTAKENQTFEHFNRYFAYVLGLLLLFLVGQRDIENLRYFTLYSFFIFVFIICVFVVQAPLYISDLASRGQAKYNFTAISFHGLFSSFGCLLFAYNAIVNFYTVVGTVQNPTTRRLKKIFFRTFGILGLTFIVVGLIAYLCFGAEHSMSVDLFIFREKIGESDVLMIIGRSLLIVSLATGAGINAYPLKMMLLQVMKLENCFKVNIAMSVAIVMVCTLVASLFSSVTNYVAFAGSFCATLMVFTYPCLIGLKTRYCAKWHTKAMLVGFMVAMTALGLASSYVSLLEFFDKSK